MQISKFNVRSQTIKKPTILWVAYILAEDMRFELTEACTSPPFQDGALNRSANPPAQVLL